MNVQELMAANRLAVLVDEQGLTPATLAGLVHDFITLKGSTVNCLPTSRRGSMSKKPKHDAAGRLLAKMVRCRWCGRQPVKLKRGRIQEHVTPGNQRCLGIGQPVSGGV